MLKQRRELPPVSGRRRPPFTNIELSTHIVVDAQLHRLDEQLEGAAVGRPLGDDVDVEAVRDGGLGPSIQTFFSWAQQRPHRTSACLEDVSHGEVVITDGVDAADVTRRITDDAAR